MTKQAKAKSSRNKALAKNFDWWGLKEEQLGPVDSFFFKPKRERINWRLYTALDVDEITRKVSFK
jgi:hypothetical protein